MKNIENKISFNFKNKERRQAFRLQIQSPLNLRVNGESVDINDISADGISFLISFFKVVQGDILDVEINLNQRIFSCKAEVLCIRDQSLCCCCFVGMTSKQKDQLHKFIIKEQKKIIRNDR